MARSRAHAHALVRAGGVRVDGVVIDRPAYAVHAHQDIGIAAESRSPWVNRGAEKLVAALDEWGLAVTSRRCLDVGASTGGFTQVLLSRGAAEVVALDVGHDQLHPSVAADPRVVERSGTTIREQSPQALGGSFEALVADLSFISLRLVMGTFAGLLATHGTARFAPWAVLLVKPQFEVGRERLGKGGIVTDPAHRVAAIDGVIRSAAGAGLATHGVMASPITGRRGNAEYLLWLQPEPSGRMDPDQWTQQVEALVFDQQEDQ